MNSASGYEEGEGFGIAGNLLYFFGISHEHCRTEAKKRKRHEVPFPINQTERRKLQRVLVGSGTSCRKPPAEIFCQKIMFLI